MKPNSVKSKSDKAPPATSTGVLVAGGPLQHLSGEPFPVLENDDLKALCADSTTIRQVKNTLLVSSPFGNGRHMLFGYAILPDGMSATDLARHVEEKTQTSKQVLTKASQGQVPIEEGSFVSALANSIPFRRRRRLEGFVRELTSTGFARHVVAIKLRRGKAHKLKYSSIGLKNAKAELLFVLNACLIEKEAQENPIETLDADLLAEKIGGKKLNVFLPSAPNGIALVATDVHEQNRNNIDENLKLLDLLVPPRLWVQGFKRFLGWLTAVLVLIGVVTYLALPAPVYIRGAALSTSGDTTTLALSFPAFLERSFVRPGEVLKAGDQIMILRSPDLDQALEQEKLTRNLEKLNAQEALEQNDFNGFQLAQSRQNLSATRLEQLLYRRSLLDVRAGEDVRILSVLPNAMAGAFLNIGTELARIQSKPIFEAQIDVNPVDAVRLNAGQIGELFLKGLPGEVFSIETQGVPVLGQSPNGQSLSLTIQAKVLETDQSALIPGLSGYAKIEIGEAPRFIGVFRKISDYVRFNIWKLLGLDI